jgi:transposase
MSRVQHTRRAAARRPGTSTRSRSAVQKLDALFAIERDINRKSPVERLTVRQEFSMPLMAELHDWLNAQLGKISRNNDFAKAINYMLRRWDAFTLFLADGRVCLSNHSAERALRCMPLGRKSWLFCGSDRDGQRAAVAYSLIQTCRLNDVDPQAWMAEVLARIADHPVSRLDELLPWNWRAARLALAA